MNFSNGLLRAFILCAVCVATVEAQTSVFTYQGKLNDGGVAANGSYDMRFTLFDAVTGGSQVGSTFTATSAQAAGGIFTVEIDFGTPPFSGADRFLETAISPAGQNNFTTLAPRQKLNSAPYAMKSLSSETSTNSLNLGGTAANQFVLTSDTRMSDARPPLPGSGDYVQNGTTPQSGASFNVSGTGTASVLNATTQFNLNGSRFLFGNNNGLFIGLAAGGPTSATGNVFVGSGAGRDVTSGPSNSFFGQAAGRQHTTGSTNTFIGFAAGFNSSTGSNNIFIGSFAGNPTTTQVNNSIAIGNNVTVSENNTVVLGTTSHKTQIDGRFRTGIPFGTSGADLPGRGYMETFFQSNIFQGVYTPNVLLGSYVNNIRGSTVPCVSFQNIPGTAAGVILTNCVSTLSSVNDKTHVQPFTGGLDVIKRLRPVAFRHKENGMPAIGLNTEDVLEIDPSLIARDEELAREEVDEKSLNILLISAFKEQQTLIETQREQITKLRKQMEALSKLICAVNSQSEMCKEN